MLFFCSGERKLFQCGGDFGGVVFGFCFWGDPCDFAVLDQKRGSARKPESGANAKRIGEFPFFIG